MVRYVYILLLMCCTIQKAWPQTNMERNERCMEILRKAMTGNENFLVRMHAAEALISNGYMNDIAPYFPVSTYDSSKQITGSARVQARLNRQHPQKYGAFIRQIVHQFMHADTANHRLTALESLAKLGYNEPLPAIREYADSGEGGFKVMSRWVLSNTGAADAQEPLVAMLASTVPAESFYAAYALRFKEKISAAAYRLLDSCAANVAADDPGRVLVLSAFYVHASPKDLAKARAALAGCLKGNAGERYQAGEGLALHGSAADIAVLEPLLEDESEDVRVSTANAILHISKRIKK